MQPDQLRSLIYAEADTAVGDGMARLAEVMVRVKTLKKGVKKIGKEGYDAKAVLAQFARLGVSPVPLRKILRRIHAGCFHFAGENRSQERTDLVQVRIYLANYKTN